MQKTSKPSGLTAATTQPPALRLARNAGAALVVLTCAVSFAGCKSIARKVVPNSVEVMMGEAVDRSMEAEHGVLGDEHPATIWTRSLVDAIAVAAEARRPADEFGGYRVAVLNDDELVNAFAAPGGYVYVSTGLLREAESCGQVAGVIGHELAHVTERHGVGQLGTRVFWVIGGMIIGTDLPQQLFMSLADKGFSRRQESQADEIGMGFLEAADFDPTGMAEFFELLDEEQLMPGFLDVLSTHPDPGGRAEVIRAALAHGSHPEGCGGFGAGFAKVQESLR